MVSSETFPESDFLSLLSHLVGEQHHDGVLPGARRHVLHRERVVVIFNDVEVDVGLCRTDHTWSTFDPDADVTCR